MNFYQSFLLDFPEVRLVRLDLAAVLRDTPAQGIADNDTLKFSEYPVEHASDLLRLALLWKFGGTYSDLDVITIRSARLVMTFKTLILHEKEWL